MKEFQIGGQHMESPVRGETRSAYRMKKPGGLERSEGGKASYKMGPEK